jgi:hypothetical protein
MSDPVTNATTDTVKHYLARTGHILRKLQAEPDEKRLLSVSLTPSMFDTGFNFAIAIQFAARALCPPSDVVVPEIPDIYTSKTLLTFHQDVTDLVSPITASDLVQSVAHTAGEAELTHDPATYIAQFALPNMIFHLSLSYAGLRHGGMTLGKADFDGLHIYTA